MIALISELAVVDTKFYMIDPVHYKCCFLINMAHFEII